MNIEKMKKPDNIEWPESKEFALCLTHDVDRVKKTYQYLTHFAKSLDLYHISSLFQKEEPYWNFERIMEIEEKHGVRSTFFFLNETKRLGVLKPSTWKLSLGRYSIREPKIIEIIKRLHSGGWEIGLHGSFDSYRNKKLLEREKEELENILGAEIYGIRQHYLNLKIPETWKIHYELGFKYDSSFGFNDRIGFRDKQYLPFYPIDDFFLEIPLTIMDSVLFMLEKNEEDMWRECKNMIDVAEEQNAVLTILWHQRAFNEKEFPNLTRVYERIIKECKKRDAWITNCYGIMSWLNNKNG